MRLKAIYRNLAAIVCVAIPPLMIWISGRLILTPELFERSGVGTGGTIYHFSIYYDIQHWAAVFSVVMLLAKMLMVSCILDTGAYVMNFPVSFKMLCRPVLYAEICFYIGAAVKLAWFPLEFDNGTLQNWQAFKPLSLAMFFPTMNDFLNGLLELISVFEVAYWFALAEGIRQVSREPFDRCLQLVVRTYLPALFVWWALVGFLKSILLTHS